MASIRRTETGSSFGISGSVAMSLLGALVSLPNAGSAQEAPDLSNLVFEPVLLSSAIESPRELMTDSTADEQELRDSVDQHLAEIESLRGRRRPGTELIDELGLLGVAYQGLGRHTEALEALDEAVELTIDGTGRNSLEQIPLQEQKLVSYRALNDIKSADDTEERIYALYEREYEKNSRQMYYATINLADWNTTAYYKENYGADRQTLQRQQSAIRRAPRTIGNPGAADAGLEGETGAERSPAQRGSIEAIFSGDVRDVFDQDIRDPRLRKVDRLYADYQEAMSRDGGAQIDIVIDVAKRIARLAFITEQEMDFERDNPSFDPNYEGSREQAARNSPLRRDESYRSGEKALEYIVEVLRSVEGVRPEAVAAALLDLGDWHLTYGRAEAAKGAYGDAYQALLDAGFSRANVDVALTTAMPPRIPVFATHLYSRSSRGIEPDAKLDFKGYVDVSYTVDGLGNPDDVQFTGGSAADSSRIERIIESQMRSMKFRPNLTGGELSSPGRVNTRYYYAY